MPTKNSSLTYQGGSNGMAEQFGDRMETLTLSEKCSLCELIWGWLSLCSLQIHEDYEFGQYADEYSNLDPEFSSAIWEWFNFSSPEQAFPIVKALTYQVSEGVYAPAAEQPEIDNSVLDELVTEFEEDDFYYEAVR